MTTPIEALERLDCLAVDLDKLSKDLHDCEEELAPIQAEYDQHIADAECAYWDRHVNQGEKLPPAELRKSLARRTMNPNLSARHDVLHGRRKRLMDRIRTLKSEVDAQRSLLSAYKAELEATR